MLDLPGIIDQRAGIYPKCGEKEEEAEAEPNPRHMVVLVALSPVASYTGLLAQNLESNETHTIYGRVRT